MEIVYFALTCSLVVFRSHIKSKTLRQNGFMKTKNDLNS